MAKQVMNMCHWDIWTSLQYYWFS